jgi:proteasome lid subunit RPN8/RPN11
MARLQWRDCEDVYKPIARHLRNFLQDKQQRFAGSSSRNIESLFREISSQSMSVFVEREAVSKLIQHLSHDPYNETGGVVVCQAYFCPKSKKYYTEIVASIAAPYTVGNRVHFQFTPECWQAIFSTQKQDFPGTTIVGWYHSHPGHGIFLSGTDLNTQRLSFKQIWQIAVVYDPLRKEIGFFYGAEGKRIEPIYLEKSSQQLQWRDVPQEPQPQEQPQPQPKKLELFPVPPSEQEHNSSESAPFYPSEPESSEQPERSNPGIVIGDRAALKIIFSPVSLLTRLLRKISQSYPQSSQPPDSPQSSAPPPSELESSESQPPESQPLESQPSQPQSNQHLQ